MFFLKVTVMACGAHSIGHGSQICKPTGATLILLIFKVGHHPKVSFYYG